MTQPCLQALGFTLTVFAAGDGRPGGQPAAGKVFQHTTVLNVWTSPSAAAGDSSQSPAGRGDAADPGRRTRRMFRLCGERRLTWKSLAPIQPLLILCRGDEEPPGPLCGRDGATDKSCGRTVGAHEVLFSSLSTLPGSRATFHPLVGPGTPFFSPSDSRPDLWARAGAPGAGHSPLTPLLQVLSWPEPQDEPQAPALSRLTPQVNSKPSKFSSAAASSRKPRGKLSAYKPQRCSSGPPRPWSSPQVSSDCRCPNFLFPVPSPPGHGQQHAGTEAA